MERSHVSIRARPIDRAILMCWQHWDLVPKFQSAPDQLIGRYVVGVDRLLARGEFQSAPDQLIGRYPSASSASPSPASFNPRPTN